MSEDYTNETDRVFRDAKLFSKQFAGFMQAAKLWEEIGSFHEARTKVEALKKEIEDLIVRRDGIIAEHKRKADEEIAEVRKNAEAYVKDILSRVDALKLEGNR
jgi:hypothetical protein